MSKNMANKTEKMILKGRLDVTKRGRMGKDLVSLLEADLSKRERREVHEK
jgi:hypothetical protein